MSRSDTIIDELKALAPGESIAMSDAQLQLLCTQNVLLAVPVSEDSSGDSTGQLSQTVFSTEAGMANGESKIINVVQTMPPQVSCPLSADQVPSQNNDDGTSNNTLWASTMRKFATNEEWGIVDKLLKRSAVRSEDRENLPLPECLPKDRSTYVPCKRDHSKSSKFKIPLHKLSKKIRKTGKKKSRKSAREVESSTSSDDSSSSSDEDKKSVARAKDDNWPHPLAKLIGQEGSSNNYTSLCGDERETITHNREFVRERTRNLKSSSFPTQRVGWHNSLMTIQLSQALDILEASALNKSKNESRQIILDLDYQDQMPVIDLARAKSWITEARASNTLMLKLISDCLEAAQHECKMAKVVEKDGFSTVSKFEGSPDFEPEFKKHLDYVRKESVKSASGQSKTSLTTTKGNRGRGSYFKTRAIGTRNYGQTNYAGSVRFGSHGLQGSQSNLRPLQGTSLISNNGPSAKRPCSICKAIDHWVENCPRK